jgi:transcriptional regulator with XRE-family HTH domain
LVIVNQVLVEFVMMDMVFIPERLKEIREERNLSKAAAARLLNLSKMGYLRYETGDRTPSYQTIVFMAQKLGTSPEYLTGKEDTPEPREYIISKLDDPELFALIQDMMDTKNPARTRLLAYYKELKASAMK